MKPQLKRSNQLRVNWLLVGLTVASLAGCSASIPPLIEKQNLPAAPEDFGKPVDLPVAKKGSSLPIFALQNRATAIEANKRLENDRAFYRDVLKSFSRSNQDQ